MYIPSIYSIYAKLDVMNFFISISFEAIIIYKNRSSSFVQVVKRNRGIRNWDFVVQK